MTFADCQQVFRKKIMVRETSLKGGAISQELNNSLILNITISLFMAFRIHFISHGRVGTFPEPKVSNTTPFNPGVDKTELKTL